MICAFFYRAFAFSPALTTLINPVKGQPVFWSECGEVVPVSPQCARAGAICPDSGAVVPVINHSVYFRNRGRLRMCMMVGAGGTERPVS